MMKNVNQEYYIEHEPNAIRNSFKRLFKTVKHISKYRSTFLFLVSYFFYIDGVNTIIKMATSYGTDLGLSASKLMIILLVLQIVAFPFAIIYGKLAEKYSPRKMILVGIVTYTFISVFGYFMTTELHYWILAFLVGSAQGGIQALSRSYFGKLIPKEKSSEFFGIYNIVGKFSAIFGPLLMGLTTQITGDSRKGVLSLIILFVIGLLIFLKVDEGEKIQV